MFRKPEIWAQDVYKVGSFWEQWGKISSMHFHSFWWFPGNFWPFWRGYVGSIPELGMISPGEGNGNPLQYSCPKNLVNRGNWWPTALRAAKNWTWLSDWLTFPVSPLFNWLHLQWLCFQIRSNSEVLGLTEELELQQINFEGIQFNL